MFDKYIDFINICSWYNYVFGKHMNLIEHVVDKTYVFDRDIYNWWKYIFNIFVMITYLMKYVFDKTCIW